MLIGASGISKSFSERVLFDNVSFNIDDNDKIGFIGANGTGKSTLFKIIMGFEDYDKGELFLSKGLKFGYLDQYSCSDSKLSLFDEMLLAYEDVIQTEKELEDINLELELGAEDSQSLINRQNYLNERLKERDGFFYKNKVRSTLLGLGFSEEDFSLSVSKLSGGQKTRVELGKILLSDANLLLLDEPTNHLDIDSINWLEEFLRSYKGAFVVISHDRYFLDRVTNKTFDLDYGRFYSFNSSYTDYQKQKDLIRLTEERKFENTKKEIERLEGIVEQQRRWNREKNIKTAESKQKVIERLQQDLVKPNKMPVNMFYDFKAYSGGGFDVLDVSGLSMSFGDNRIFSGVDIFLKKGEKVFLLGPNGCGKTTLLKIILGKVEQMSGTVKIGTDIHIGYYDQIQENLSMDKTVIDEIWDEYPDMKETEVRNALAQFQFKGEDVFKEIKTLSGGERARVELTKLILKKVNFLIMDEPTNHLDVEARESLENALSEYGGTMLMVSHDRYFINKLADRIIYLESDGVKNYLGNYDEFISKLEVKEDTKEKTVKVTDYHERKRLEAEKRKTVNDFKRVEEQILKTEDEVSTLQRDLEASGSDFVKAAELSDKITELEAVLLELYGTFEELENKIEEKGYTL